MLPWKSFAMVGALLAWSSSALADLATPVVVVADAGPDASACDVDSGALDAGEDAEADASALDAGEDGGCSGEDGRDVPYIVVAGSSPEPHYDVDQECCGFRIAPRGAHSTAAIGGLAIGVALLARRRRR